MFCLKDIASFQPSGRNIRKKRPFFHIFFVILPEISKKGLIGRVNVSYTLIQPPGIRFRAIWARSSSTLFPHRDSKFGRFLKVHFGDYVIRDDVIGFSDTGKESSIPASSNGETHSFLPWHRKSAFSLARVSLSYQKRRWPIVPRFGFSFQDSIEHWVYFPMKFYWFME